MALKLPSSAFTKNLVQRTKLIQHYEPVWARWDGPLTFTYESKEKDDAFHPSGDCTPSSEALYLKVVATMAGEDPDPISPSLRKAFLVGHFWHQVYQHLTLEKLDFCDRISVERMGMSVWAEDNSWGDKPSIKLATAKAYHWARGSADIAPCEVPKYGPYLVDFKTMNARDFAKTDPPAWTADKWECQLNIYMNWFDLDRALIIGICKDSPHELKEFEYRYNEPLVDAIYEKWHNVSDCLDHDIRPASDEDPPLPLMGYIAQ